MTNQNYQQPQNYEANSSEIDALTKETKRILKEAEPSIRMSLALQFIQSSGPQPVSLPYFLSRGTFIL